MSYLLDALRKSEAQRQLGELPTLATLPDCTASRSASSGRGWLLLAVLVSLAAVVVLVWQLPRLFPTHPAASVTEPDQPVSDVRHRSAHSGSEAGPTLVQPADAIVESHSPRRATGTAAPARSAPAAPTPREIPPPAAVPANPATGSSAEHVAQPPASVSRSASAQRREYLLLRELPAAVRSELPALNIMAHIYAESPEGRFVLMNGRRYAEGDDLGQGATLVEIRREGAVVDFREYRFLVE